MLKNQINTFVLRGSLGGAIGWLLFVAYIAYKRPFNGLALPYAPFIGAILGAIIGVIIWICFLVAKRSIGIFVRSLIGVGLVSIVICLFYLAESRNKSGGLYEHDEIGARDSKGEFMAETVMMVVLGGALPAAMARPKR